MATTLKCITRGLILLSMAGLAGCGGAKVLKEPVAMDAVGPLATVSDSRSAVSLDWVVVRDGPGTWSKNADWDEYLIRFRNISDDPITVESVVVVDYQAISVTSSSDRKALVKGTKATSKRYKDAGIKVKAGFGGNTLAAAGAGTGVAGMSLGVAVLGGSVPVSGAAVALGAVFAAPVIMVGGAVRGINNVNVAKEIRRRHTTLPLQISAGDEVTLDLFYPLTPSPGSIEIVYRMSHRSYRLTIDTREALHGLHLPEGQSERS